VLPGDMGQDNAKKLIDALHATGKQYGCPVVGGDISIGDKPLIISVTVLAETGPVGPVLRSGANAGDVVCVTGRLGGAWRSDPAAGRHLAFEPRIETALALAEQLGDALHSMIDLSDGLASDLAHICRASNVAGEIELPCIPMAEDAGGIDQALGDGEDYELCFTVDPAAADNLPAEIDGIPVTPIGRIVDAGGKVESPITLIDAEERRRPCHVKGWDHHD